MSSPTSSPAVCRRASAATDAFTWTTTSSTPCSKAVRGGPSNAATALRPISIASKNTAAWRAQSPSAVSVKARRRQQDEMGTLGSGNHYLEVQRVAEIHDA